MTEIVAVATRHGQFAYSPATPPCATVLPGATLRVATRDPRSGALLVGPPGTFQPYPPPPGGRTNALTGPIRVEGAEPGDVLVVDVRDIALRTPGYMAAGDAGLVVPRGRVGESLIGIVDVQDGDVVWREGVRFPCRPMVGEIGVADPSEPRSGAVGRFGGNMDHAVLGAGCRVYLPVFAPGALLYIGDVHAAMGDGELSGGGVEIAAEVTCTLGLVRRRPLPAPRLETADRVITVGWHRDFGAARRMAVEDMLSILETRLGMRPVEALMLISAVGDLRVGQACGSMDLTLRLEMPKRWPRLTAAP
jgi:amidase